MIKEPSYFEQLSAAYNNYQVTNYDNYNMLDGVECVCSHFKNAGHKGHKVILVGNGGSASIASHMAIDLSKNSRVPAIALNDASALTCLANDYGYDQVFAKQIQYQGRPGDILVAISSSGNSANILCAVEAARKVRGILVFTFSGFAPSNHLRNRGEINFYVPSSQYGFVELTHQIILHQIVDALTAEHERLNDN